MAIGCKVTLRGEKMYEFVDRLINLALPRVRDFRGVNPNAVSYTHLDVYKRQRLEMPAGVYIDIKMKNK